MSYSSVPTRQDSPTREKLSLKTKLAYGAGDMGAGITSTLESFAFLIFLTDVAGLSAGDYDERTNLTSFRFAFSIGGSILALALGAGISALFPEPGQLQYMVLGAICAVLSVLPIYWCVWGTQERYEKSNSDSLPLREQLKIAFSNRPFLFVIGIYLFSWLAFQLTAAIIPYYVTNWMGLDQFFQVALIVQGTAIVMLFVWSRLSDRIGKKAVYFAGMALWILAQIGLFFLSPEQVGLLYVLSAIAGCGVAIAYLIPWSMLPDVVDLDELRTGQRREGIFYAFMVLLQKVGLGLGLFVVGQVLELAGFVERVPGQPISEQPESALLAIRLVVGPLPALILIGGLVLTYFYPITRNVHAEILLKLRAHQSVRSSDGD